MDCGTFITSGTIIKDSRVLLHSMPSLEKMEIDNVSHLLELQHLTVKAGLITFLEMLSFLFTRKNVEEKKLCKKASSDANGKWTGQKTHNTYVAAA